MLNEFENFLSHLKADEKIELHDETTIRQVIINKVLNLLGWDVFNDEEVKFEHSVEKKRVDYALFINGEAKVFIEAKKPAETLDQHQEQLLDYSFRETVELAILTNGLVWWFYLPLMKGKWNSKKVYTIDVLAQEQAEVSSKFYDLLSKVNVESNESVRAAQKLHKKQLREDSIMNALPEAWNILIKTPDSLLVDLIAETTESQCGYKPDDAAVKKMLSKYSETFTIHPDSHKRAEIQSPPKRGVKDKTGFVPSGGKLFCENRNGLIATAIQKQDGFTVLKDSMATLDVKRSLSSGYRRIREKLIEEGILVRMENIMVLTKDYTFTKSSPAASIILGRSANGNKEWRTHDDS